MISQEELPVLLFRTNRLDNLHGAMAYLPWAVFNFWIFGILAGAMTSKQPRLRVCTHGSEIIDSRAAIDLVEIPTDSVFHKVNTVGLYTDCIKVPGFVLFFGENTCTGWAVPTSRVHAIKHFEGPFKGTIEPAWDQQTNGPVRNTWVHVFRTYLIISLAHAVSIVPL